MLHTYVHAQRNRLRRVGKTRHLYYYKHQEHNSHIIKKESGPKGPGFELPPEGASILFPPFGSRLE